jgi:hypothetical protein
MKTLEKKELISIIGDEIISIFDNCSLTFSNFNPSYVLKTKMALDVITENHYLDELINTLSMILKYDNLTFDKDYFLEFVLTNTEDITDYVKAFFDTNGNN